MAKRVIQLYDKYKSTTKVYPLIVGESITNDAKEEIAKIADAEIEGKVPEVEANPELAGTEAELGSIQIGETKYKIGGGKQLYQHNISLLDSLYKQFITFTIISSNSSAMSKSDIVNYIKTNFNSLNPLPCNAILYYSNVLHCASALWINYENPYNYFNFYGIATDGTLMNGNITTEDSFTAHDNVIAL